MSANIAMKQFTAGSCYSYILSSGSDALIVDPHISLTGEYAGYLARNRLNLRYILDTHTHADHFSAAAVLKKQFGAPVLMHSKAVSEVADRRLDDGDEISIGSAAFKAIYTPGHTDDALSLYNDGKIFTGDVLLIGSVGRTDFQNGSPESMFETLRRLKVLPEVTLVFPGHDYNGKRSSSIGREKKTNPYLRETSGESFAANMRSKVIPKPFNMDNIIRVNRKGEAALLEMISPRDAFALVRKDPSAALLDVRSALEFSQVHIKDSINAPIDALAAHADELGKANRHYIVFCRSGNRSPMAADILIQSGIQGVKVISLATSIAEGLLYFVPEPKSPHGVDVTPDGTKLAVGGKLDTHATVFDFAKIKQAADAKNFTGKDPYGVPIIGFQAALHGQVELGLGPLHTNWDAEGNGYTSLFQNKLRLNIGRYGTLEAATEEVTEVNETNNLSEKEFERRPRFGGGGGRFGGGRPSGRFGNRQGGGRGPLQGNEFQSARQTGGVSDEYRKHTAATDDLHS